MKSLAGKRFGVLGICAAFVFGCAAIACVWMGWSLANPESGDPVGLAHDSTVEPNQTEPSTLEELALIDSQFSRILALYNFALGVDEADFLDLIEQTESLPLRFQFEFQRVLVDRLYEINPELALSHVDSFHTALVQFLFLDWAERDLEDAIARVKSLEGATREAATLGMLSPYSEYSAEQREEIARELGREDLSAGIASEQQVSEIQRDPEQAWNEALRDYAYEDDYVVTLVSSGAEWIRQDGLEIVDEISASLGNVQAREYVLASVLVAASQFVDIEDIFSKALEIDAGRDSSTSLLSSIVGHWTRLDPESALDAASEVESSFLRDRLQSMVIYTWANNIPRSILDDLDRIPKDFQAIARMYALTAIAQGDPKEAISLLQSLDIEREDTRESLIRTIASIWAEEDAKGALSWALNDHEHAGVRSQLLRTIVWAWSSREPNAALNWILDHRDLYEISQVTIRVTMMNLTDKNPDLALQRALEQPVEKGKLGWEGIVIGRVLQTDLELAKEMLPHTRDGKTKRQCYIAVGCALVRASRGIEALELARELVEWEGEEYVAELLSYWAWDDADGLQDSLDDISDPEIRASAEAALEARSADPSDPFDDYWEQLTTYKSGS